MNEGFFIGNIIEIEKFKFIINPKIKHRSKILIKIKLIDGNILKFIAYDNIADYILRNDLKGRTAFVQGKLKSQLKEIYIVMNYIKKF